MLSARSVQFTTRFGISSVNACRLLVPEQATCVSQPSWFSVESPPSAGLLIFSAIDIRQASREILLVYSKFFSIAAHVHARTRQRWPIHRTFRYHSLAECSAYCHGQKIWNTNDQWCSRIVPYLAAQNRTISPCQHAAPTSLASFFLILRWINISSSF